MSPLPTLTGNNIRFLAIARASDKVIVCSYIHQAGVSKGLSQDEIKANPYYEIANKVIKAPTFKEQVLPNTRHSLDCNADTVHFTMDTDERIFIAISASVYPARLAFNITEAMKEKILPKYASKIATSAEAGLDRECVKILNNIAVLFDDRTKHDIVADVQQKVEDVKIVMHENIKNVLASTEKLENVEEKTTQLNEQAKAFRNQGRQLQRKMWWRNFKMNLVIGFAIILVLLILLASAGVFSSSSSDANTNNINPIPNPN